MQHVLHKCNTCSPHGTPTKLQRTHVSWVVYQHFFTTCASVSSLWSLLPYIQSTTTHTPHRHACKYIQAGPNQSSGRASRYYSGIWRPLFAWLSGLPFHMSRNGAFARLHHRLNLGDAVYGALGGEDGTGLEPGTHPGCDTDPAACFNQYMGYRSCCCMPRFVHVCVCSWRVLGDLHVYPCMYNDGVSCTITDRYSNTEPTLLTTPPSKERE